MLVTSTPTRTRAMPVCATHAPVVRMPPRTGLKNIPTLTHSASTIALAVFASAIVLALCVNVGMFFKTVRGGILTTGAWVAHTGIALVLVGVLVTSIYSKTTPV